MRTLHYLRLPSDDGGAGEAHRRRKDHASAVRQREGRDRHREQQARRHSPHGASASTRRAKYKTEAALNTGLNTESLGAWSAVTEK